MPLIRPLVQSIIQPVVRPLGIDMATSGTPAYTPVPYTVNSYRGRYILTSPASSFTGNRAVIFTTPVEGNGNAVQLQVWPTTSGNVRVSAWTQTSPTTFTRTASQEVAVVAGLQTIAVSVPIADGQFIGFSSDVVCLGFTTSSGGDPYWVGGSTSTHNATSATVVSPVAARISIQIKMELDREYTEPANSLLPFEKMLLLGAGQSNMEGGSGQVTTAQEYDTLCFPAYWGSEPWYANLIPAFILNMTQASGVRQETPIYGAAKAVRDRLLTQDGVAYTDVESTIVLTANALGGTGITALSKGTARYDWAIGRAAILRETEGPRTGALAVAWVHGEEDADNGMPAATYKAALAQLASDYDTDLRAAFSQARAVPLVCSQVCQTYLSVTYRYIGVAQLEAANENALVVLACPTYMLTFSDALHVTGTHSRILGAYLGAAAKQTSIDGVKWEPLQPTASLISGNTITLTFNKSGLAFDTTTLAALASNGFSVTDASDVTKTISSTAVVNGNQVEITMSTTPIAGWKVKYGIPVTPIGGNPYLGAAGNLRDSAGDSWTFDGWAMHNWCALFDWTL